MVPFVLHAQTTTLPPAGDDLFQTDKRSSKKANAKVQAPAGDDLFETKRLTSMKDSKVWYQGEVNLGYGMSGDITVGGETYGANMNRVLLETIHGVRITPYAYVGGGLAFQYSYHKDDVPGIPEEAGVNVNALVMPLFLNIKGLYPCGDTTNDFTPYVSLNLGYNVGVGNGDSYMNGGYGSVGVGFTVRHFNLYVGWEQRYVGFDVSGYTLEYDHAKINSWVFKIGGTF